MHAEIIVSDERLITREGTICPVAVRLAEGRILLFYSTGNDAWFTVGGAQLVSEDNGLAWTSTERPLPRVGAIGNIGEGKAVFLDQYLLRVGSGEYAVFANETRDGGRTFGGPRLARVFLENALDKHYVPRAPDDPNYFYEPEIPAFYDSFVKKHGAWSGGHFFGSVIRLPDGALGASAYCQMKGNMRRKDKQPDAYVGVRPDEGVAEEAADDILWSSLFFRSEDEGKSWRATSVIGRVDEKRPYDAGLLYSEGFTETGLACTSDGKIYALMRHGSYMLLWRAISSDGGRTWSDLMCFNHPGVAPSLCLMPNGVLAAAWGRPGMTVGFSLDGTGLTWDVQAGIMHDGEPSQKYPCIIPAGENRLMLFYDRRKWDAKRRAFYDHGIYSRTIEIRQH